MHLLSKPSRAQRQHERGQREQRHRQPCAVKALSDERPRGQRSQQRTARRGDAPSAPSAKPFPGQRAARRLHSAPEHDRRAEQQNRRLRECRNGGADAPRAPGGIH